MANNWTEEQIAEHHKRIMGGAGSGPLPGGRDVTVVQTGSKTVFVAARACDPKPSKMNKTEQAFHAYLELQKRAGQVVWFDFGAWTFKLGDDCRYTPDFPVLMPDATFRIYDTKGRTKNKNTGASMAYSQDDSKVKIRVAAKMYPMFKWFFTFQERSGAWTEVEF